jgi:hypothetical protein
LIRSPENIAPHAITILLSTFNGAAFLQAQLASFAAQTHPNWRLYWRDDGSSDRTTEILAEFAAGAGAGRCVQAPDSGLHLGATPSFLSLLSACDDADLVAFADQDDVWLPEKLANAVERIGDTREPTLYFARQYLADEQLRPTGLSPVHDMSLGFPANLTHNIATGNSMVMNAGAVALINEFGRPEGTVHDWWSYIVVSACGGRIIFDERPVLLYRQHKNNLIGVPGLLARAVAALRRGPYALLNLIDRHTETLAERSGRLSPQARIHLKMVQTACQGGLAERFAALRCPHFQRRTALENLLFRYWFLTRRPPAGQRPTSHQDQGRATAVSRKARRI